MSPGMLFFVRLELMEESLSMPACLPPLRELLRRPGHLVFVSRPGAALGWARHGGEEVGGGLSLGACAELLVEDFRGGGTRTRGVAYTQIQVPQSTPWPDQSCQKKLACPHTEQ